MPTSPTFYVVATIAVTLMGLAKGGFAGKLAHAGQPPFQMWVMLKNLPPVTLAGTSAL